jgi:RNA polymerase sigma-70 factor, ECF subfamily
VSRLQVLKPTLGPSGQTRLPIEMDEAELNEAFAKCLPRLQKAARKMLGNRCDSEDALQDALLLAYRKLHQFEGRASFSTWLHSIVRNTARAYYRNAKAHPTYSTDDDLFGKEGDTAENLFIDAKPNPEEGYACQERTELLRTAARNLPENYEAAIHQFYAKGVGEENAARNLGISTAALKGRLHRGRILLARRLRLSGILKRRTSSRRRALLSHSHKTRVTRAGAS